MASPVRSLFVAASDLAVGGVAAAGTVAVGLFGFFATRNSTNQSAGDALMNALSADNRELRERIDRLEERTERLGKELRAAEERARQSETLAHRFDTVPDDAKPMRSYFEDGWHHNHIRPLAAEHGVIIGVYLDDIDGQAALGYKVIPVETATLDQIPDDEHAAVLAQRVADAAAQARASHGLPPWINPKEKQ